jgi:hypothetical protein
VQAAHVRKDPPGKIVTAPHLMKNIPNRTVSSVPICNVGRHGKLISRSKYVEADKILVKMRCNSTVRYRNDVRVEK